MGEVTCHQVYNVSLRYQTREPPCVCKHNLAQALQQIKSQLEGLPTAEGNGQGERSVIYQLLEHVDNQFLGHFFAELDD